MRRLLIDTERMNVHLQIVERMRVISDHQFDDPSAAADQLVAAAVEYVPGALYASISVLGPQCRLDTVAAAGDYPAVLDAIQMRHRQGPCVDAARHSRIVEVHDLAADERWPLYRRDVLATTPIRSSVSLCLSSDRQTSGALNIFAEQPGAFSADAVEIAEAYATHAALAWDVVRRKAQWRNALVSRNTISRAKAILEKSYGVNSDDAFALLRRLSAESMLPLAEVARRLVSRSLPSLWRAKVEATAAYGTVESSTAALGRLPAGLTARRRQQLIREATRC